MSQHTITAALVSLDKNTEGQSSYGAELRVPMSLAVSAGELRQNIKLQQAIEQAVADSTGVDSGDVSVDTGSVVDEDSDPVVLIDVLGADIGLPITEEELDEEIRNMLIE